jgi:hypothetical protein
MAYLRQRDRLRDRGVPLPHPAVRYRPVSGSDPQADLAASLLDDPKSARKGKTRDVEDAAPAAGLAHPPAAAAVPSIDLPAPHLEVVPPNEADRGSVPTDQRATEGPSTHLPE